MLKKIFLSAFVCLLLSSSNVNAATLNVSVSDLDSMLPNGIYLSQILFEIDGDWQFESSLTGNNTATITWPLSDGLDAKSPYSKVTTSIPGYGDIYSNKWAQTANQPVPDLLIIALNDNDYGPNLLGNGLLFTLTYPEEVKLELKLSEIEFVDTSGALVNLNPSATSFGAGDNDLIFSQVPIPSTLLLLGGGIAALVGGTRRKVGRK